MTDAFKDHFSSDSPAYQQYRPHYPEALFGHLAAITPGHARAWDCATGTGQAAIALTNYFDEVIATDASEAQIQAAQPHTGVHYRIATAEHSTLDPSSVDLISVAQALHWFGITKFETEVRRVLKPGGILAAWTYGMFKISPDIDREVFHFYEDVLGAYWPAERVHVENAYADLHFTLEELPSPAFAMQAEWTLPQVMGYLQTWSAVNRYRKETGHDPLIDLQHKLQQICDEPDRPMTVLWPLTLRVFRR